MKVKIFIFLLELLGLSVAQYGSAHCTYHMYEQKTLLTTLSCSDGKNGLIGWAGNDLSVLWPYVTAWEGVEWNSPKCGTCMRISNKNKQVFVTVVDQCGKSEKPGSNHFDMSKPSFYELFGDQGIFKGTMEANYEVVSPSKCKGNKKVGGEPIVSSTAAQSPPAPVAKSQPKTSQVPKNIVLTAATLPSAANNQKIENSPTPKSNPSTPENVNQIKKIPVPETKVGPVLVLPEVVSSPSPDKTLYVVATEEENLILSIQQLIQRGIPKATYDPNIRNVQVEKSSVQSFNPSQQIPDQLIKLVKKVLSQKKDLHNLKSGN